MKWLVVMLIFSALATAQSTTPNLGLTILPHGAPNWDTATNSNWHIVDSIVPASSCLTDGTQAVTWDGINKEFVCQSIVTATCNVRNQTGSDLGAKINACTAKIGFTTTTIPGGFVAKYIGTPGIIRVDSSEAGPISTQVIIPSNQTLSLGNGHYTNNFGEFIPPITLSDNSALACDSWATQIDNTTQNIGENPIVGMTNSLVCSSPAPPPCGPGGCENNCADPPTVGVTVNSCHFKQSLTGSALGTSLTGTVALTQCQGCKVLNSWFDGIGSTAVTLTGAFTAFSTHPEWSYIFGHDDEIAGNLITGSSNAAISVINNQTVDIHDNIFRDHGNGAASYVDLESNSSYDYMQFINLHDNLFDCSKAPAGAAQCYGFTLQSVGPNVGHIKVHDNILFGPLVPVGGYTVGGFLVADFNAHGNNDVELYNNQISYTNTTSLSLAGGDSGSIHDNLLTCAAGGITLAPAVTSSVIASNVFQSPAQSTFTITSVATSADLKSTVYTGTFTGGAANGIANQIFTISGFTNPANNGTFGALFSTATTLTVQNGFGVSETHAATAVTGCSSGLTGAQNNTKIVETDATDDFNVYRDNVGAGQILTFGTHSRIVDTKAADGSSQTIQIPTGFASTISGGVSIGPITAPVLNGAGPTNIAVCTSVLVNATYDYIVTAVDANGSEAPSNEVAVPNGTTNGCAKLGWTYAAGAASYNIYRGTASGNELLMTNVKQGTLGYADPGGQTPGAAVPVVNTTGGLNVAGPVNGTVINGVAHSERYSGTLDVRVNACISDAETGANGAISHICDSTGEAAVQGFTGQITVGDASFHGVKWLLPPVFDWTGTLADNTKCEVFQYGGAAIVSSGTVGAGATGRFRVGNPSTEKAQYCSYNLTGNYISVEGVLFYNVTTTHAVGYGNIINTLFDTSVFKNTFFLDQKDTCGLEITGVIGADNFEGLAVNGNFGTGVTPLCIVGTAGGFSGNHIDAMACNACSIVHPGAGQPIISVTDISGIAPTAQTSLEFNSLYMEGSTSDTTAAAILLTNVKSIGLHNVTFQYGVNSSSAPMVEVTYPAGNKTSIFTSNLGLTAGHGITAPAYPQVIIKDDINSAFNVWTNSMGMLPMYASAIVYDNPSPFLTNPGNNVNQAGIINVTPNTTNMREMPNPFAKTTTKVCYETGTTADNTAATYDVGVYAGAAGGAGTLLGHIGPTAGTTFAPATNTFICINWLSPFAIPAGPVWIAWTTSQTVTSATLFGGSVGNVFAFNSALAITTGGTLPASIATLPAISNSGAGNSSVVMPWFAMW